MGQALRNMFVQLWADDCGLVATEYLMVGTMLTAGLAGGLAAMRDAVTAEMQQYSNSVHAVTQAYRVQALQSLPHAQASHSFVGGGAGVAGVAP
jgi:hypothetical protein